MDGVHVITTTYIHRNLFEIQFNLSVVRNVKKANEKIFWAGRRLKQERQNRGVLSQILLEGTGKNQDKCIPELTSETGTFRA